MEETDRHLTLVFLGDADLLKMEALLPSFPKPTFPVGPVGIFSRPIFLPEKSPHVAAWEVDFLEEKQTLSEYQKKIISWARKQEFHPKHKNGFLPHVTIARKPENREEWKRAFEKLPLFVSNLHLCESLGNSRYHVHWSHNILKPFEEIEHTADIAFTVRGKDYNQLYLHAQIAMAFHFPPLIDYFHLDADVSSVEEIISELNRVVAILDAAKGAPFKAVSFHGKLTKGEILEWEMVVDV